MRDPTTRKRDWAFEIFRADATGGHEDGRPFWRKSKWVLG